MADYVIPIDNTEIDYTFDVPLGTKEYRFHIYFNNRLNAWFFDISNTDDTSIIRGQKINTNADLLKRFKKIALPKGRILGVSMVEKAIDPTQETLGNNIIIMYEE